MDSNKLKTSVLLLIGVGLLLNPIYLVPETLDGSETRVRYDIERVTNESTAKTVIHRSDQTLQCGGDPVERACTLERRILEQGPIESDRPMGRLNVSTERYKRAWSRYTLVSIDDGFYVPDTRTEGNTTRLSLREVSPMDAVERIAVPSRRMPVAVREAAETGSVTVLDRRLPVFERHDPVVHDGDVYYRTAREVQRPREPTQLVGVRLLAFVGGGVCIAIAWKRRGQRRSS
ncbi:hypothetical protein Natpe_2782 [Natrinema pellirubrum DSM 15624]|uniref:Uncharacterized protein n=1 Tax=Natrinema pellirubrum (strain DSM 15624 / CIP 106293 / JCM 10476 / NCIMB 786 / 157) TaxID=797303 RepID=L0JMU0_NATP1|nr:hypothetical protein Natpe_2782 [Natrinema pellirubrum DSM 15624]